MDASRIQEALTIDSDFTHRFVARPARAEAAVARSPTFKRRVPQSRACEVASKDRKARSKLGRM
jgi:hypothetical protein